MKKLLMIALLSAIVGSAQGAAALPISGSSQVELSQDELALIDLARYYLMDHVITLSDAERILDMQLNGSNNTVKRLGFIAREEDFLSPLSEILRQILANDPHLATETLKKIIVDDLQREVIPKIQDRIAADEIAQWIRDVLQSPTTGETFTGLRHILHRAFAAGY